MPSPTNHLPHLLMLLHATERLRAEPHLSSRFVMPEKIFLACDQEDYFWELIAFRVTGHPSLIFGAVRFRRQAKGAGYHRQSLVSYLSSPLKEVVVDQTPLPAHLIEVLVPDTGETVLQFLERSRSGEPTHGEPTHRMLIDRQDIEFAFDLRIDNPSRHRPAGQEIASAQELYLFRTRSGHLISAHPHRLGTKLLRSEDFLALTRPTQHTAAVDRPLPTLVMNRSFITMAARVDEGVSSWLEHSLPFQAELANTKHLLDPLLESYREYRQRLVRDEPMRQSA